MRTMQKRLSVGLLIFLAGVLMRSSAHAVILPPPPPVPNSVTLTWDYPDVEPGTIVFNVYASTNPASPVSEWQIVTNVAERSCVIPVEYESCFFAVSASNVVSGTESSFAGTPAPEK